jgi:hypothetical protein
LYGSPERVFVELATKCSQMQPDTMGHDREKGRSRMRDFQLFIAEHKKRILFALQNPEAARDFLHAGDYKAPSVNTAHPAEDIQPQAYELDISGAEAVTGGSYIYPAVPDGLQDWYALARTHDPSAPDVIQFTPLERLPEGASVADFISTCYLIFFDRTVDDIGMRDYSHQLKTAQITRRDLIRILLTSDESQERQVRFLLVQEPDLRLIQWGLPQYGDAVFPSIRLSEQG